MTAAEMPGSPARWHQAGKLLLLALAYFAAGKLGLALSSQDSHIALLWLPAGIAVAALLRWGASCWPGVLLGALLVALAAAMAFAPSQAAARRLFLASVVYLPVMLVVMALDPVTTFWTSRISPV